MNRVQTSIRYLLLAACLGALSACGSGSMPAADQTAASGSSGQELLPALPAATSPAGTAGRTASVNLAVTLEGDEYFDTNGQVFTAGELILGPEGPVNLVWAIYALEGLSADAQVTELSVAIRNMNAGGLYYFGLADYEAGGWELESREAAAADQVFSFAADYDPLRHLSGDGTAYVLVLTWQLLAIVDYVSLEASTALPAPQNLTATDGESADSVVLSWDAVTGAEQFDIFYKLADEPDEFYSFLTSVPAAANPGFEHTADNPPGKPALYAQQYDYYVRSAATDEDPSEFSAADSGFRQLPGPLEIYATERVFSDKVRLQWFTILHEDGDNWDYEVWRDGELLDTVNSLTGSGGEYDDTSLTDMLSHDYYVVELGPEGPSLPSAVATGCLGSWSDRHVMDTGQFHQTYMDMQAAADDTGVAAVCYWDHSAQEVWYSRLGDPLQSLSLVTPSLVDARMSLINYGGVPWIAYSNDTDGLMIARASSANPPGMGGWATHSIDTRKVNGEQVVLKNIGGRLAVLYQVFDAGDLSYTVYYAFAKVELPTVPADWDITEMAVLDYNPRYFDLDELSGLPIAASQGESNPIYYRCDSLAPTSSGNWSLYEMPVNLNYSERGVDLAVHDGVPHFAMVYGGFEQLGAAVHLYPLADEPGSETDWLGELITEFNDQGIFGVSLLFVDGQPWISWSDPDFGTPTLAVPYNQGPPWFSGGFHLFQPVLDPGTTRTRNETKLLLIDGEPALAYQGEVENDGVHRELKVAYLAPKPGG